jgi:hypothetical protein
MSSISKRAPVKRILHSTDEFDKCTDKFEKHAEWIRDLRFLDTMSSLALSPNQGVMPNNFPPLVKRQKCTDLDPFQNKLTGDTVSKVSKL